ncbi:unnamed protein product [Adineta steineri]|uniref:Proteasome activator complex subunit 4 C-terminal domain-containing protein n=1 Tax=Adineta steineri TaxID=433720 RepID=A0A819KJ44_9BILA|nr:unnamed protein product [Adineta steineri]
MRTDGAQADVVGIVASTTLSGFYQCGYIEVTREDLNHFDTMSKINYITKINGKKTMIPNHIIKRHAEQQSNLNIIIGVLGLCAIVLSSPYDIPIYIPDVLMSLCQHSYDPDLIHV